MSRTKFSAISAILAIAALAACTDYPPNGAANAPLSLAAGFASTPAGYGQLYSSFPSNPAFSPFAPNFGSIGFGSLGFMGGGLGDAFLGDGLGAGFGPGPFGNGALPGDCSYSSSTGIVTCTKMFMDGLTITRTAEYMNAAGTAQPSVDSTTNTITTGISVTGTVTDRGHDSSTVNLAGTQTVSGLAAGSTSRTVNGATRGTETTSGTSNAGAFSSMRTVGDTTTGLVLPVPSNGHPSYPMAGTVVRAMELTVTLPGKAPTSASRREAVTYNGTSTATVVITTNGATTNCTQGLPHGRLSCP
jgi:hypothetical protein